MASSFLSVNGTAFMFDGSEVFLSGANQPWIEYGRDFGNAQSNGLKCELEDYIKNVSRAGGNSIRMWLFTDGSSIPAFDESSGFVTAADANGTLVDDLTNYLQFAGSQNVFIHLCLWNGGWTMEDSLKRLIVDDDGSYLDSFIENALTPLVTALRDEPALGSWEIMNEPEGSVRIASDEDEPCFDTMGLSGSGAGWTGTDIRMEQLLRFANRQAAAIKAADPKALVTVGSWSEFASTDATLESGRVFFDYYKDACLVKGGGEATGTLDFAQIHTYADSFTPSAFSPGSPMSVDSASFELDRPIVVGEFSTVGSGRDIYDLYGHALGGGYGGAWDWSLHTDDGFDDESVALAGVASISSQIAAVSLGVDPPLVDTCDCSDLPPDDQYTCVEQATWGQCDEDWMVGFCCKSCFSCQGCE